MPPDHWTTAKLRRPGWLPGTVVTPDIINIHSSILVRICDSAAPISLLNLNEVAIILTKLPPDHWTTAKLRRPGWLPGTVATPDIMNRQSSILVRICDSAARISLLYLREVTIILTKVPPAHWTTAKLRRPGWLPETVATPDIMNR